METENSPPVEQPSNPEDVAHAAGQPTKKTGREPKVTVALVKRVSKRVGRGIPISLALAGEPVTHAAYKKHLQRHPELAAIQEGAKIKFLDKALDMIVSRPGPMLRWLLERRPPRSLVQTIGIGAFDVQRSMFDVRCSLFQHFNVSGANRNCPHTPP